MSGTAEGERTAALLEWYSSHGRHLPWRGGDDPYPILVSEMMLQQTQVSRVAPYFERFIERFPSVSDLAAAPFSEVAAAWSGLGYNRRAKRLHDAARAVASEGWPTDAAGLATLPGVGDYTAAAVAAFAYGEPVVAVDTNLRRVLSRWHGEPLSGRTLVRVARSDMGDADAADWNQAMMDLGAVVCRPRNPECPRCPVSAWCAGPGTYTPPRSQPRFEGSLRQARGAIVRALVRSEQTFEDLVTSTGFGPDRLAEALDTLIEDDLVEDQPDDGSYRLVD